MFTKIYRAIILGAPASGKGTVSKLIVDKFAFVHISAGDLLRLNIMNGTELGKKAKGYIEKGQLVPDELITKVILSRITETGNKSWLLDGFPRTVAQAASLNECEPVDAVINLQVPHDVIVERVKSRWIHLSSGRVYNKGFNDPKVPGKDDVTGEDLVQRPDDKPEIVQKRLEIYDSLMQPVLDFYAKFNLVNTFCGRTTAEIWPQVEKFLQEENKQDRIKLQ